MRQMQSAGTVLVEDGRVTALSSEEQFVERGCVRVDLSELVRAERHEQGYRLRASRAGGEEVALTRNVRDTAMILAYEMECE